MCIRDRFSTQAPDTSGSSPAWPLRNIEVTGNTAREVQQTIASDAILPELPNGWPFAIDRAVQVMKGTGVASQGIYNISHRCGPTKATANDCRWVFEYPASVYFVDDTGSSLIGKPEWYRS